LKQPEIANLSGIFEASARYKAPVFQRLYVWKEAQLSALMEDIETADSVYGQFLGAIVLKDLGRLKGPTSPSNYLMVDGQQRLTTFFMLFAALAQMAREYGDPDTSEYIAKNYLAEVKSPKFAGWPKLVPTLQDRFALWEILTAHIPEIEWNFSEDPAEDKRNTNDSITPQWKRILAHYKSTLVDSKGVFVKDAFERTLRSIQEYLKLIVITLEEADDANAIFSRLNAKGVPLDLADLVRNEVFSKFETGDADKAEKFYYKTWQPFEKRFPGQSLNQFFPVYSYIAFKGKVTKSAAFPSLQEKWSKSKPGLILADLEKYAPFYIRLTEYEKHPSLPPELNAQLERFSRMPRTTVTWPFLIETLRAAAEKRLQASKASQVLQIVESFLVRRSLMGVEPTGLHAVFKTLWDKTNGEVDAVLEKIVTRTIQVPDDGEIRHALSTEPVDTRVVLRYVFQEYERDFTTTHKYDLAPTVATIEHVAPQHLSADWAKEFSESEHKRLVGLIGNLAALSEAQNKSLQDEPWGEKRKRFKGSDFKTTQALAAKSQWGPEAILDRTRDLTKWIISRWPPLDSI
jgi:hypothetical protein